MIPLLAISLGTTDILDARYIKNYDADTITVDLPTLPPLFGHHLGIRVKDINSPELRGKKPCEKELAKVGKDYVRERILNSRSMVLGNPKRGKYFRIVADILLDGESLGEELLELNLASPYGRKVESWCDYIN